MSAFGAAFFGFGGAVGSVRPAALRAATANASALSALGSATFIGGGAGSPLNFCQSPVTRKIAATGSVGWAPTPSQYWARSELTSMKLGSSFGWYLPIVSITRPSRFVRASATTIR